MIDLKKTLFLLLSSSLAFAACGDDDTPADADAAPALDGEPDFDAAPDPTFSGTLSLAEVSVTNPEGVALGLKGGAATISFTDPADVTVAPQPGYDNNIGGCRIFVYDVAGGEAQPGGSDGGAVSVTGTNVGDFACAYNGDADRYLCSSTDSAASGAMPMAGTTATPGPSAGQVTLTIPGADFQAGSVDYSGMHVQLAGFIDADMNGLFPILAVAAPTTLIVANPDLAGATTLAADSGYQTLVGAGPVPGGVGSADFLDDGTNDVTITKAEATNSPAVDSTLNAHGEGFALASTSATPHAMPTDGSAVTFSCAGDGECGPGGSLLKGIITFGETTDADLTDLDFNEMPDATSKKATWQCSGIGAESIELDAGAMALILGTNPTRIQVSVTYAGAELSGPNNIVLSHGVVGFTDVPAN